MSLEFTFIAVPYMLHLKFVVTDGSNLILPLNTFFFFFLRLSGHLLNLRFKNYCDS